CTGSSKPISPWCPQVARTSSATPPRPRWTCCAPPAPPRCAATSTAPWCSRRTTRRRRRAPALPDRIDPSPLPRAAPVSDADWHSVALAPTVLVHGTESLIAERAVQRLRDLAREADPTVEIHDLSGEAAGPGALAQVASPSLFGEPRFVVVPELQAAPDHLVLELLDYVKAPEQDVTLVLVHRGGNRGKKLLDALKQAKVPRVDASPVKRAADKQAFVAAEFARAQRRIQPEALIALVDAFGTDLAELAAISRQLIEDTTPDPGEPAPQVSAADVHALTAGRVESTAFAVAD